MKESVLQKSILKYCKSHGILAVKMDSTSTTGWPDLTVIVPGGKVFFIELKTATGILSAKQKYIISKIKNVNGEAHVVKSLMEFKSIIDERSNRCDS